MKQTYLIITIQAQVKFRNCYYVEPCRRQSLLTLSTFFDKCVKCGLQQSSTACHIRICQGIVIIFVYSYDAYGVALVAARNGFRRPLSSMQPNDRVVLFMHYYIHEHNNEREMESEKNTKYDLLQK